MKWRRDLGLTAIVALLVLPTYAPQLLAFSHRASVGDQRVYSESPIDRPALERVVRKSAALVSNSPIALEREPRRVFLTDGGWRWSWLALRFGDAFAVSRPLSEPLIFNRSDVARDRLYNGDPPGAVRSLSGTLAHEVCHGMIRRHFGVTADWTKPAWLREGYCDHVAEESTLSDADAARLKVEEPKHPALLYYDGRKRVAAALARNGGNVEALFAAN